MSHKKISRRVALGIIGKTGISLASGTYFFLSLKTSPLTAAPQIAEKVMISGAGSRLTVRISSRPGRHCAISYATIDSREHYKAVANSRCLIGENGMAGIEIDVRSLPNGKIFLRVVTGNTSSFTGDIAGTEAFVVKVSKGIIAGYEGLLSRPLESDRGVTALAAGGLKQQ